MNGLTVCSRLSLKAAQATTGARSRRRHELRKRLAHRIGRTAMRHLATKMAKHVGVSHEGTRNAEAAKNCCRRDNRLNHECQPVRVDAERIGTALRRPLSVDLPLVRQSAAPAADRAADHRAVWRARTGANHTSDAARASAAGRSGHPGQLYWALCRRWRRALSDPGGGP